MKTPRRGIARADLLALLLVLCALPALLGPLLGQTRGLSGATVSQRNLPQPMSLDNGYAAPPVTVVRHPSLKSWMIEHHWLRGAPGECNPGFGAPFQFFPPECSPYLFNHGADAALLTLFFDGSIERLRSGDVAEQDQHLMDVGMDGLWSRDTPLGPEGYFGDFSSDGTIVSHHILTTGGILGRDRLVAGDRP